jgi:hypothetical protein
LSIVVTMRNGDVLRRYVDERDIEALMEPSTQDPSTWSERQVNLWLNIHYPGVYSDEKLYVNRGREIRVSSDEMLTVNAYRPCSSIEEAFDLKLRQYVALFNRSK